jgi:hypothetical protein
MKNLVLGTLITASWFLASGIVGIEILGGIWWMILTSLLGGVAMMWCIFKFTTLNAQGRLLSMVLGICLALFLRSL